MLPPRQRVLLCGEGWLSARDFGLEATLTTGTRQGGCEDLTQGVAALIQCLTKLWNCHARMDYHRRLVHGEESVL